MHLSVIRPYSTGRGAGVEGTEGVQWRLLQRGETWPELGHSVSFCYGIGLVSFLKLCLFQGLTLYQSLHTKVGIGRKVSSFQSAMRKLQQVCGLCKNQLLKSEMEEGLNRGPLVNLYCVKGHRRIGIPFSGHSPLTPSSP